MVSKKSYKKVIELVEGEGRRKNGVIAAVDVHKSEISYCIGTGKQILDEGRIKNIKKEINFLIKQLKDCKVRSLAMESTAQYHFKLLYELINNKIPVLVANPRQTKDTQGKKTDKLDARRIFIAHRDGRLKPSVISPEDIMNLRKSMRQLIKLIQDETKAKQRLSQIFHLKDFTLYKDYKGLLKSDWGFNIMQNFLTADIEQLVSENQPNKCDQEDLSYIINELKKFKSNLTEIEKISFMTDISQLIMLDSLIKRLRLVYLAMAEKNSEFRIMMKLLLTIGGIGPDTAAAIIAEIVDISYFPRPEKLVKWAGLAPKVMQSGHRKKVTGKIHKGGNKYLRRALALACQNIYSKHILSNQLYDYIKSKYNKSKKDSFWRAICAAARKLLTIIWYMLTQNQEFKRNDNNSDLQDIIQNKIQKKIQGFEKLVDKYRKIYGILDTNISTIFNSILYKGKNPKILLEILLKST